MAAEVGGVDSRLDQGSNFWFEVGLGKSPTASDTSRAAPIRGLPTAHVLLAEDDVVNRLVVGEMLKTIGCVVDVVEDGEAACSAAARVRYDLVFMDCHCPHRRFEPAPHSRAGRDAGSRRRVALTADAIAAVSSFASPGDGRLHDQAVSGAQLAAGQRWVPL